MTTRRISHYLVYRDEASPRDKPWGLFRRVEEDGKLVATEAFRPRTGEWHHTDYWWRLQFRGDEDRFLVEVDDETAMAVVSSFQASRERSSG